MPVISIARWNGGSRDAVLELLRGVKPIHKKYGGECRLAHIHTGLHAGHWVVSISYPDWDTHAKATVALSKDTEHQKLRDQMTKISHMDERVIHVELDL